MRKLLWLIACLVTMVTFTSCNKTYLTSAEYEVCYPDGTQRFNESISVLSTTEPSVVCYSVNGTNYVAIVNDLNVAKTPKILFRSTTAPIRLKTYDIKRVKRNGLNRNKNYEVKSKYKRAIGDN